MKDLWNKLSGKKSYLIAVFVALVVLAHQLGWIDSDIANTLLGLLGAGGLMALRHGVAKLDK